MAKRPMSASSGVNDPGPPLWAAGVPDPSRVGKGGDIPSWEHDNQTPRPLTRRYMSGPQPVGDLAEDAGAGVVEGDVQPAMPLDDRDVRHPTER